MKVLHIIKDLEPGGMQASLLNTFENKDLFEGTLGILVMGKGRLKKSLKEKAGQYFYEAERSRAIDLKVVSKIRDTVKQFKPDIVHTHHTAEMFHAWLALKKYKHIRKVHTFHASPKINTKVDYIITRLLESKFDLFITPTQTLLSDMQEAGYKNTKKYDIINYGIPGDVINKIPKEECRHILGLPQNDLLIGMAGTFYANVRDQMTLCKAMAHLEKFEKPVRLVFAGAGKSAYFEKNNLFEQCKKLVNDLCLTAHVIFLEHVDPISHFYGALDLYVHSSVNDTFGLAPAEALLNKLPLITTELPVFKEIFADQKHVEFFPEGNYQVLAKTINNQLSILQMKQENDTRSQNTDTLAKFSMDTYFGKLKKSYEKALH